MNTWAPLWSKIVYSSIWDEPDLVCKVFLTMMAVKDADHVVRFTPYELGKLARKDELEVLEALKVLSSPDTKRVEQQEYEGRRIKAVPGGWLVLNGEKYKRMMSEEMRKARNRRAQQAWRDRKKQKELPGEARFVEAMGNGATAAELDKLSDPAGKKGKVLKWERPQRAYEPT